MRRILNSISATIDGTAVVILIFGDDTGTNVVEFNANTGAEMASFFNPATTLFDHVDILTNSDGTDGRIALTYDVPDYAVDPTGATTQYVTDIYDLRTSGLDITTPISTTSDQYFAGTQYGDTIVGSNDVNNTYDFVGDNTSGPAPAYSFTGGTGTTSSGNQSWNVVILPDTPSDYTISVTDGSGGGTGTIINTGDPTHAGTLTVSGIQALAFSPTIDPSGNAGSFTATGAGPFIYGPLTNGGEPITIENGSTLQLFAADNSTVTFTGANGHFVDTDPSSFTGTVATSSGTFASTDIIDVQGLSAQSTDTFQVVATLNGSDDTVLTVTDENNDNSASVKLAGDYQSETWTASYDGGSGADVIDPTTVVAVATIAAGASLDIGTASSETVTFTGGTGSLVLADPEAFSGQIVGFTGTAPDAANSDTIDLVGINYDSPNFAETYNATTGLLTVTDGTNSASMTFDNFNATLDFASDGDGGTLITDPPATGSSGATANASLDWGMKFDGDSIDLGVGQFQDHFDAANALDGQKPVWVSGDDNFIFHANLGAENNGSLNQNVIAQELQNHPNVGSAQQLTALVTPEAHHVAFIDLVHNDSFMLPSAANMAPWHHMLAGAFHLH